MTTLTGCPRCGEDHDVDFKIFKRFIVDDDGIQWTEWAPCPVTGDPILCRDIPQGELDEVA